MRSTTLSLACAALVVAFSGLAAAAEPAGGTVEGITVHGHWRIEVVDPDGTVVSTTEFENALVDLGLYTLQAAFTGEFSIGALAIQLIGPNMSGGPCESGFPGPGWCFLVEPGAWVGEVTHSENVVVSETTSGIQLTGSVTAAYAESIVSVASFTKRCYKDIRPEDCAALQVGGITFSAFTRTTLPTPVPVQPGQIVNVTVNLSFS